MGGCSIRSRAPHSSSETVRKVMQANRGDELNPERNLRSLLQKAGLRFRKNYRPIPSLKCKADIVFPSRKLCIFVDGCFWHGCSRHFKCPSTNPAWWQEKINATKNRDLRQAALLRSHGWRVLRFWEHQVRADADRAVRKVAATLAG